MGDSQPLGNLSASLEELSLKKQLPLRQQAPKPILKYRGQLDKPVQLFNSSNIVTLRNASDSPYNYSGSGSTYMLPTGKVISAPFKGGHGAAASGVGAGTGYSPRPNQTKAEEIDKKVSQGMIKQANPYARPLSAKDVATITTQYQKHLFKLSSSSTFMQSLTSSNLSSSSTTTPIAPATTLQTNSFMLPHSGLRSGKSPPKPPSAPLTLHQCDSGTRQSPTSEYCVPEELSGKDVKDDKLSISPLVLNNDKAASICKHKIYQGNNMTSTQELSSRGGVNIDYGEPPSGDAGPNAATLPFPGYAASSITSAGSHPSSTTSGGGTSDNNLNNGTRIRNPNYTPMKPYSEVKHPEKGESPISDNSSSMTSSVANWQESSRAGTPNTTPAATVIVPPAPVRVGLVPKPPPHPATPISVLKGKPGASPVMNLQSPAVSLSAKSSTSIQYYRKGSKSEVQIHEHGVRLKGDGAPSATRTAKEASEQKLGQSGSSLQSEAADEGEESEFGAPSGERLPGDGETSQEDLDNDDDDDDDGIDDIDDDFTSGSDDESDSYSITSNLSKRSLSTTASQSGRRSNTASNRAGSATSERRRLHSRGSSTEPELLTALTPSLFSNIPPTVHFVGEGQKVEQLPWEMRKYLKWRLSPITPNVVKAVLARVGFRITKRGHDWLGCFGKHMKSQAFKAIRDYQKINHFPGSFQLGRKDRLWRNLSKMQVHFGKKEFGFFPQTFVLPFDLRQLKRAWEDGGSKQKWIIKPPASARGIGIKVIHKWTQIPRRRPVIVQRYLARPFLINDSKFDMRVYVYVSSCDPLRIYVYEDGLTRFASCKYSAAMKNLNNKFMHLTNYSVNKKNEDYQSNSDDSLCQGHKWSLKSLWMYMRKMGINTGAIWDSIKDLIVKTVISAESSINSMIKANCKSRYSVHELFGFDILLDETLRPWILEVNISPSLHSNSQLDINIKGNMIKDLFNIAGWRIPDKHDVTPSPNSSNIDLSTYIPPNDYCMDKRQFSGVLSPDERAKHAYYCQRHQDDQALQTLLDTLTPDDIRILTESIDEDSRKGSFQRVFPTPTTHRYLRFFEQPRYFNLLLDQWVLRYNRMEARGIALLESYCDAGIHFDIPTDNPGHQWTPPSASIVSYREPRLLSAPVPKLSKEDADPNVKTSVSCHGVPPSHGQLPRVPPRRLKATPGPIRSQSGWSASNTSVNNNNNTATSSLVLGRPPRPPPGSSGGVSR